MTQYVYDAEGGRAAKGTITAWPASGAACAAPTAANGFTLTSSYLRGVTGQEDAEIASATGAWRRNVFGPGGLLASYNFTNSGATPMSLSFVFNDWLGTKRLEVNQSGQLVNWWSSDPFGNYLTPYNTTADPNEQHFTGKERDAESGNDYFGARYYASSMGRFMSPDWASNPVTIPFGNIADPQSLNLYSYVGNNPLVRFDPYGHLGCPDGKWQDVACAVQTIGQAIGSFFSNLGGGGGGCTGTCVAPDSDPFLFGSGTGRIASWSPCTGSCTPRSFSVNLGVSGEAGLV